jgi:hypothetical protein
MDSSVRSRRFLMPRSVAVPERIKLAALARHELFRKAGIFLIHFAGLENTFKLTGMVTVCRVPFLYGLLRLDPILGQECPSQRYRSVDWRTPENMRLLLASLTW